MQKKIIALAVAGLASTAAFAQSNVTIYGSVDAGYAYRWDAESRVNGNPNSRSSLDTGMSAGNRLGFKGVEDLGNGLKAVFLLEQGFNFDSGATGQNGTMFGRQAYVGLAGGFGTAVAGRLYTPHFTFTSALDPFSAGTVGQARNVFGATDAGSISANLIDPVRVDNAVAYISPSFGGVQATLAYSNSAGTLGTTQYNTSATVCTPPTAAQLKADPTAVASCPAGTAASSSTGENAGNNARNNTVYAALIQYTGGPFMAGINMHRIAVGTGAPAINNSDTVDIGGSFDAKVVKISALYTYVNVDYAAGNKDQRLDNYMLGITAPIGKAAIKAAVTYSDGNSRVGGDATQYVIGADYALSKRTNFYTAYSLIDANTTRMTLGTSDASNSGLAAAGNAFQQGFAMGVRHQF